MINKFNKSLKMGLLVGVTKDDGPAIFGLK